MFLGTEKHIYLAYKKHIKTHIFALIIANVAKLLLIFFA